jgi:hypothetical protein
MLLLALLPIWQYAMLLGLPPLDLSNGEDAPAAGGEGISGSAYSEKFTGMMLLWHWLGVAYVQPASLWWLFVALGCCWVEANQQQQQHEVLGESGCGLGRQQQQIQANPHIHPQELHGQGKEHVVISTVQEHGSSARNDGEALQRTQPRQQQQVQSQGPEEEQHSKAAGLDAQTLQSISATAPAAGGSGNGLCAGPRANWSLANVLCYQLVKHSMDLLLVRLRVHSAENIRCRSDMCGVQLHAHTQHAL